MVAEAMVAVATVAVAVPAAADVVLVDAGPEVMAADTVEGKAIASLSFLTFHHRTCFY